MSERRPRYIKLEMVSQHGPFTTDGTKATEPFGLAQRLLPTATIPSTTDWDPGLGLDVNAPKLRASLVFYLKPSDSPVTRPPEGVQRARILCVDPAGTAMVGVLGEQRGGLAVREFFWIFRAETGPEGFRVIHTAWRASIIDELVEARLCEAYAADGCDAAGEPGRIQACLMAAGVDDASYERRINEMLAKHGLDEASRVAAQHRAVEAAGLAPAQVNDRREALVREQREAIKARLRAERPYLFERIG